MNDNPKLRKNGGEGTKVGNFLRKIDFAKTAEVVGNLVTGNIKGAIDVISNKDNGMTTEEREFALTVMRMDIEEMESVTRRWESDMNSDSCIAKNVTPFLLIFLK